jgi:hypothetical protein
MLDHCRSRFGAVATMPVDCLSLNGSGIASPVLSHSTQEDDVVARDGGHGHAQFKFRAESLRLVVPACDSWMTLQGSVSQGHHRGAETVGAQPRVAEDIARLFHGVEQRVGRREVDVEAAADIGERELLRGVSREKVQHGYGTACVEGRASHSIFELRYCKRAYVKLDLPALAAGND